MITDKEILDRLKRYMEEENATIEDIADDLDIGVATLYRWKTGKYKISKKGRKALIALTVGLDTDGSKEQACPIPECPAKSADRLLQFVLENWKTTSAKTRGNICSLIETERLENINNSENITPPQK